MRDAIVCDVCKKYMPLEDGCELVAKSHYPYDEVCAKFWDWYDDEFFGLFSVDMQEMDLCSLGCTLDVLNIKDTITLASFLLGLLPNFNDVNMEFNYSVPMHDRSSEWEWATSVGCERIMDKIIEYKGE